MSVENVINIITSLFVFHDYHCEYIPVIFVLQAHQVQAMFPHMPLDIIMDDLRHTHSLEVTIDNILQGNISVPSVSTQKGNR